MIEDYDPKLKEMMNEIDLVFKKYGTNGLCMTHSRTHGEFKFFFAPWSAAQLYEGGIRFNAKQTSHDDIEDTVFALLSMKDMCVHFHGGLEAIEKKLHENMVIDHTPLGEA